MQVEELTETARDILDCHDFSREDVRKGSERCMLLQKLILESQCEKESLLSGCDIIVSDRSGADPLVYVLMYGRGRSNVDLTNSKSWIWLRSSMQKSLVILCPPVKEWLFDDGTRLMPEAYEEWYEMHKAFRSTLESNDISFYEVPLEMRNLKDRIRWVQARFQAVSDD